MQSSRSGRVAIKMAGTINLSLNRSQISGKLESGAGELPPGHDIFTLLWQSNTIGRDTIRGGTDDNYTGVTGRVFQYGYDSQTIVAATNPLDHVDEQAGDMGFWLEFVKAILPHTQADRDILLAPNAQGGTSLSANNWNQGNTRYNLAVSRANAAYASGSGTNVVRCICGIFGESDADNNNTGFQAGLQAAINALIADMDGVTSSTLFIFGTIKPDKPNAPMINAALTNIDTANANVIVVDLTDLAWFDANHYNAASCATIGQRFASAYLSYEGYI